LGSCIKIIHLIRREFFSKKEDSIFCEMINQQIAKILKHLFSIGKNTYFVKMNPDCSYGRQDTVEK